MWPTTPDIIFILSIMLIYVVSIYLLFTNVSRFDEWKYP